MHARPQRNGSIVRDLIDTGMRLDEVLKNRSKFPPHLYT
jgi:hypothetical protein